MVIAVGLAACSAEEEPGPRFANDPAATSDPTAFGSAAAAAATPTTRPFASPVAPAVDPADLLRSRGAPGRLYFRSGGELWTIGADGSAPAPVLRPARDETITAVAASPDGDRVAVLLGKAGPAGETASIVVLDAAGEVRSRGGSFDPGPAGGEGAAESSIDWSPQGDRLLVSSAAGGILALPAGGGDAEILLAGSDSMAPGDAAWSPTGEAVAFLAPAGGERPADLFLARTVPAPGTPEALVEASTAGRSVTELAWTPDGRDLLYTLAGAPDGAVAAGDLWRIATDGSDRRVVVSAGSAVPVGRIALIAPSPDGDAVAYTVMVPGDAGQRFHSLWIRSLGSAPTPPVRLSAPAGESVSELWWTDGGLVFRTEPDPTLDGSTDETAFSLYRASATGEPTPLYRGSAAPAGSPEASPTGERPASDEDGTPGASPVTR